MEIERKWLLSELPNDDIWKPIRHSIIYQSYLNINPEVRIREKDIFGGDIDYKLTIKGNGDLTRTEVEKSITKKEYVELWELINKTPIKKEYFRYKLEDELVLECSLVDNTFFYAEIEFESKEQANTFVFPKEIKAIEITDNKFYKMKNYWGRTKR